MAKINKYYAVRKGSVPGIYRSWEECKYSVEGFPGAEYKSFSTEEEAQLYMDKKDTIILSNTVDDGCAIAYVDGSFNSVTNRAGYGAIIITTQGETVLSGIAKVNNKLHATLRQITGEVAAVLNVIDFCRKNNIVKVTIYYDYAGLEYWANGTWKTNNDLSKEYQSTMQSLTELCVEFIKVPAHANNKYNERADQAAKIGCGIVS